MLTTLTILSREQGKLYAGGPDVDRIPEHMLRDVGFNASPAASRGKSAKPTWRARLDSWAVPFARLTTHHSG